MNNIFPKIGVGTMLWVPTTEEEKEELFKTFQYCLDRGYNFFDTAEVYGNGKVEQLLGEFIKRDGRPVRISSKFAPPSSMNPMAPKRKTIDTDSPEAIWEALDGTLSRLGIDFLDLYLMHTPPKNGKIADYALTGQLHKPNTTAHNYSGGCDILTHIKFSGIMEMMGITAKPDDNNFLLD